MSFRSELDRTSSLQGCVRIDAVAVRESATDRCGAPLDMASAFQSRSELLEQFDYVFALSFKLWVGMRVKL